MVQFCKPYDNRTTKVLKPQDKPPAHPKTSEMVNSAIKDLADRGGSSLASIKKYIAKKYDLDSDKKTAYYIRKYLKQAVADGSLVQTKGKGANGSFKMPSAASLAAKRRELKALEKLPNKKAKSKKPAEKAKKSSSAEKNSPLKKKASIKNLSADGKSKSAKSETNKLATKSPKAKKITKTPTSKPKAPRPRKIIPASKSTKPAVKKNISMKAK